jgi:hypothetical protein
MHGLSMPLHDNGASQNELIILRVVIVILLITTSQRHRKIEFQTLKQRTQGEPNSTEPRQEEEQQLKQHP